MMAQNDWNPDNPPEPAVKYKVTTSASPSSCYTSGGGSYSPGQQIWINSSSYSSGYRFLYWTKNGERYSEQQSFNYTVEEQDVAFVAYYEYNPESPAEPDGVLSYRLYLLTNLPGCCSFNRGSGDKVKVGETVGLNAYLNQGYKFLGWYMGDELLSESTWYSYQMPANDVTLTAMVEYSPDNPDDPPSNRPLTPIITVKNCERVYGDANPVFEYVKNKEIAGEPVITCEADATSPVGTYTIKIERGTIEDESVVLIGGTLTITKSPLTISAGYYTRNLGEDNPAFVPTYSGFKNDETNEVLTTQPTVSCEATKESPVGEYEVTVSGAEATNYNISYVNGKLTVVEPYLTVTANSYSRVYGDANPDFGYTVTGGVLYGTPTITCDATESSPVGTYTITIAQGDVTSSQVTYVNGILTITKAPLTIKAGDYTRNQGEDNPTFTPTYEGFKNSENADVLDGKPTLTCVATKDSPVGEYDIIVSGAWDDNYEISYVNGKLTITPIVFESGTGEGSEKENTATYRVLTVDSTNPTVAITIGTDVEGSFTIPENVTYNGVTYKVTEIAPGAFENNVNISEITIPGTISKIGANAFKGCSNLKTITVYATTPPALSAAESRSMMTRIEDGSVFDGVDKENCILYVPEASINLYKSSNVWKDFVNIQAIGETGIANIVINNNVPFDVYDINGRKIRNRVKTIEGLPKGLYIVNGKRILIH